MVKHTTTVVLSIANYDTTQDQEEEQGIKYLSHKQMFRGDSSEGCSYAKQLLQKIEGSPSNLIYRMITKSVVHMVSNERQSLYADALEGVDVDNTLGSLVKLADVLWIEKAFKLHKQGEFIDLFKPYVIGRQFLASDRTIYL